MPPTSTAVSPAAETLSAATDATPAQSAATLSAAPDTPAPKAVHRAAGTKAASKVPAAENTLRILKLLASRRGPMAASNIATALGLPRSSVYHLLGVMEANGSGNAAITPQYVGGHH